MKTRLSALLLASVLLLASCSPISDSMVRGWAQEANLTAKPAVTYSVEINYSDTSKNCDPKDRQNAMEIIGLQLNKSQLFSSVTPVTVEKEGVNHLSFSYTIGESNWEFGWGCAETIRKNTFALQIFHYTPKRNIRFLNSVKVNGKQIATYDTTKKAIHVEGLLAVFDNTVAPFIDQMVKDKVINKLIVR